MERPGVKNERISTQSPVCGSVGNPGSIREFLAMRHGSQASRSRTKARIHVSFPVDTLRFLDGTNASSADDCEFAQSAASLRNPAIIMIA